MLNLNLKKEEYITIGEDIVIQVYPYHGQVTLRVEAPREVPVLRGDLRERAGATKPAAVQAAETRGYEPKARVITQRERETRHHDKLAAWQKRKDAARVALEAIDRYLADVEPPELREKIRGELDHVFPLTV